jgi:hypothetical protein
MPDDQWIQAAVRQPARGQRVDIGRFGRSETIEFLDTLYWYPMNWNLHGMWWRPAAAETKEQGNA